MPSPSSVVPLEALWASGGNMPRLVSALEILDKVAALNEADDLGRYLAQQQEATRMAKVAGALLAHRPQAVEDLEKLARSMVTTGLLSEEDFEQEKAAAFAGMGGLFSKLRAGLSGIRSRVGGLFNRTTFNPARAAKGWGSIPAGAKTMPGVLKPAATAATAAAPAAAKAAKGVKGFGWGKALPWLGLGGAAYGLYKGVPWLARQLEQTSTTPMAHGLGWSPVPYGYGYTPYGEGMQTMGPGA